MTNTEDVVLKAAPTERKGRRRMGIATGGVLALIAIGVAAALGFSSGDSRETSRPARYDIEIHNGWPQTEDEKHVGNYLESEWRNPLGPVIAIDSQLSDEAGPPIANAELAQIQTYQLPGYRERGLKRIRLGGRPVVQWAFDIPKDESTIEFFFEECGTSFIVRASTTVSSFETYADAFREMASTIKIDCDE